MSKAISILMILFMVMIPLGYSFCVDGENDDEYYINDIPLDDFIMNNPVDNSIELSKDTTLQKLLDDIMKNPKDQSSYEKYASLMNESGNVGFAVFVFGKAVDFKNYDNVEPMIENGRTLVPIRALAEAIGASVGWDDAEKMITIVKGDKKIVIRLDSNIGLINGEELTMDVPAKTISGRTMIPLRFVSEAFGMNVGWYTSGEVKVIAVYD